MLKAIETVYNGYRFRSRLEARWAVFFDTLGIKYEYEKEGYDLDGTWYLPDFWIEGWNAWVEIKPFPPNEDGKDVKKCLKLSSMVDSRVLLIIGNPWLNDYIVACYRDGKLDGSFLHFAQCRRCNTELWLDSDWDGFVLNNNPDCHTERSPIEDDARLIAAYAAARQARFEQGR